MKKSFTITRAELVASDEASLRIEILRNTGSETDAESVLRSLERLGSDPSIDYYEISSVSGRRMHGGAATNAWRVRADRGVVEPAEI